MTTPSYPSPRPRIRFVATVSDAGPPSTGRGSPPGAETGPRITAEPATPRRRRLPNKGCFPPNTSGNPKGRPKGAKGAKAIARKVLTALIDVQTARGARKVAYFEALLTKETAYAAEGDWRARRTIFEFAKWALGETTELPQIANATAEELTETGKSIIEWFTDEVNSGQGGT